MGDGGPSIGLLFPLSGTSAEPGRECAAGSRLALEQAGLRTVLVDAADGDAAELARRLVHEQGVPVVVGTLLTALSVPASDAAVRAGASYVEIAAVADELGRRGLPGFIRTAPRAAALGRQAVSFATSVALERIVIRRAGRAALLYEGSSFGRSLGMATLAAIREHGLELVVDMELPAGATDVAEAAARLATARPDAVFAACYTPTAQALWRGLRGSPGWPFAMIGIGGGWIHLGEGDAAPDPDGAFAIDVAPTVSLRAEGLSPDVRQARERYLAGYRAAHSAEPTVYSDLGFVGGALLVAALREAGTAEGRPLVDAFRTIDLPAGGTLLGYGARFDGAGENSRAQPFVMQWQERELHVVHPDRFATTGPALG